MISRRKFLGVVVGSGALYGASRVDALPFSGAARGDIDRAALVDRHNPALRALDPLSPLTVGNGEFAFTADITGLQTLPAEYENKMPLCTMSQWGWHTRPAPGLDPAKLRPSQYDSHGRSVGYHTDSTGQTELFNWLRQNPHRLHLGQIGLCYVAAGAGEIKLADISEIEQRLDLWSGILTSRFRLEGVPVTVRTAVHPTLDQLAVSIESRLVEQRRIGVRFAFPYGSPEMNAADWTQPARHETKISISRERSAQLRRVLDSDEYFVAVEWSGPFTLASTEPHAF
ncbi:MAG: hypothetical protein ABIP75_14980, partial [Pyrinomonadaceae bacterium]